MQQHNAAIPHFWAQACLYPQQRWGSFGRRRTPITVLDRVLAHPHFWAPTYPYISVNPKQGLSTLLTMPSNFAPHKRNAKNNPVITRHVILNDKNHWKGFSLPRHWITVTLKMRALSEAMETEV